MAKCAFIGLGIMGYPMAGHLQAKGHDVCVYNRTAQKAPVDKEFCSRSLRALEWALDPRTTSLAQVPPPYDLGPDMNIYPCAAR